MRAASPPLAIVLATLSLAAAPRAGAGPREGAAPVASKDPDALYHQREDLELASRAADIWKARLAADSRDFDAACKLARARLWIGESLPRRLRAPHFKDGIAAARAAIALEPRRPDGHFWLGVNAGALASVSNPFAALRLKSLAREALEASLARDPAFLRGGGYCALGKYYAAVPLLFGGDKRRSEELLRRCLQYDPGSTVGHYYLGQTLRDLDRVPESRQQLRAAIDGPADPDYAPEARVWKRRAQRLLDRIDRVAK